MERISRDEMYYLIEKGVLTQIKNGGYKEYSGDKKLVVTGKFGSGRGKQRYAPPTLLYKLANLKSKELVDMDKVKDNQKYLFSDNSSNSECVL